MPFDIDPQYVETPAEVKPPVFSLDGLIAWLEKQDPTIKYDWLNCRGGCLIGKYFAAHGVSQGEYERVFAEFGNDCLLQYSVVCSDLSGPSTFGAALARAKALRERQP